MVLLSSLIGFTGVIVCSVAFVYVMLKSKCLILNYIINELTLSFIAKLIGSRMPQKDPHKICPDCFNSRKFEPEENKQLEVKRILCRESDFSGPGKDRSVNDLYLIKQEESGQPDLRIHLFPLCPTCCGTGVVLNTDVFVQLQAEIAMVMDNIDGIIEKYRDDPKLLIEHTDRITRVLIPVIIKTALECVEKPAKNSYARYLSNLMNFPV